MSPPPPNWDDDFDFEDIEEAVPQAKKQVPKKSANKYDDDDFFDEDNNKSNGSFMLPSINTGKGAKAAKQLPSRQGSGKNNHPEDNVGPRNNLDANYEQEIYQEDIQEEDIGDNNPGKQSRTKLRDRTDPDGHNAQPTATNQQKGISSLKEEEEGKSEEEDNYDDNFEDAYDDDFEEQAVETPKNKQPEPRNNKLTGQKPTLNKLQTEKALPKPPKSHNFQKKEQNQASKRNSTLNKILVPRPASRSSVKSVNSKRGASVNRSRVNPKLSINSSFVPNKYSEQIRKSFPGTTNLNELSQDKIIGLNDQMRAMIKKLNEELNEMINKNMIYLKSKKPEKSQTIDEKLRVYEEHRKNNVTMIEYMEREFDKLCGREGELREQEYQLMIENETKELKEQIRQAHRQINRLQVEVKSEGNKLSRKGADQKFSHQLHHIKTTLIQSKKDEEKQGQKLEKLDEQVYDLDTKVTEVEHRIRELMDKAREKGIRLDSREQVIKKYQDMKKKVEVKKNYLVKLENLFKSKSDIVSHEKEQLRINIKNYDMEIRNLYESINHSQGESIKLVEKAKDSSKISQNAVGHLEEILRYLQRTEQMEVFSVRSESQHSQRPLKNVVSNKNMGKPDPYHKDLESCSRKEIREDPNKPNLHKKRQKCIQLSLQAKGGGGERVWKDGEEQSPSRQEQLRQDERRQELERKAQLEQDEKDKKKPFSLKKSRVPSQKIDKVAAGESKEGELEAGQPQKPVQEEKKEEPLPAFAGPRMMRLRRKNNQENNQSDSKEPKIDSHLNNNPKLGPDKEETVEQPSSTIKPFVPKRFNLRNRQQQDSYMPSAPAKEEPKQEPKQQPEFKINLDVEDPYAKKKNKEASPNVITPHEQQVGKETEDKLNIGSQSQREQQIRPRLNLRLRDRKKENEGNSEYLPSSNKVLDDKTVTDNRPKIGSENPNPDPPVTHPAVSNPYNPYANQNKVEGVTRKRQGPVKSKKTNQVAGRQKYNIYEEAEVAEGINEFADVGASKDVADPIEDRKPVNFEKEDVNLNDLLGLKKQKKNDDLADLLGGESAVNKKPKASKGGKNDFFEDMDF